MMRTYCAFLRGVNVNGASMKMLDVCQVFKSQNLQSVHSVLASGNIVFSSDQEVSVLASNIEKAMSDRFSYQAFVFLETKEEVQSILQNNPFPKKDDFHTYVFIGNNNIEEVLLKAFLDVDKSADELGVIVEGFFYWQVSKGQTLDSNFGKIIGKKQLKSQLTSRNINTIEKILKKMDL